VGLIVCLIPYLWLFHRSMIGQWNEFANHYRPSQLVDTYYGTGTLGPKFYLRWTPDSLEVVEDYYGARPQFFWVIYSSFDATQEDEGWNGERHCSVERYGGNSRENCLAAIEQLPPYGTLIQTRHWTD